MIYHPKFTEFSVLLKITLDADLHHVKKFNYGMNILKTCIHMKSLHVEIRHERHFISDQTVQPSQVE